MDKRPIGIFDSGIGGLTVVKEVMKILPDEDIVYFGDTARVPYGNKSPETVTKFAFQDTEFLVSKNVKALVIACNTASAMSLDSISKMFDIPIIGVIRPGAKAAVKVTRNGRIGIIGTEGTINSRAYEKAIKALDKNMQIFGYACPLFVPIVEEGWAESKVSDLVAEEYLASLKKQNVDTVVMGCTHYPLLTNVVSKIMGKGVLLINPAEATALELKNILFENELQNEGGHIAEYEYNVSDNTARFSKVGSNFLNKDLIDINKIDIEKY